MKPVKEQRQGRVASGPGSRRRGEEMRLRLLDATLRTIAGSGFQSVTHRSVAKEAGVSLALTTYYFASLTDMIAQAFDLFVARGQPDIDEVFADVMEVLEKGTADRSPTLAERRQMAQYAARRTTRYILAQLGKPNGGIAIDVAFLYQPQLAPELAVRVAAYRGQLLERFRSFCACFMRDQAQEAAELALGTVLRLEFESLNPALAPGEAAMQAQLQLLFDWIAGAGRESA